MTTCCKSKCCLIMSGFVGALLFILGLVLAIFFDMIFKTIIKNQTAVVPGTIMYNLNWADVETPVYRFFYLFNVTNKEEFLAQKRGDFVKPVLQEIGPYVYREYLKKDHITYLDFNKSHPQQVYFRQTATFFFDPERSVGSEEDIVTTLNIIVTLLPGLIEHVFGQGPALNAAYAVYNKLVKSTNSELLFTMTVGEYLFGFEDPLLSAIIDALFPEAQTHNFGLFLLTNVSVGWSDYQVYTGKGDYKLTNSITTFKNMSELPYWSGTCNQINGTDGSMTSAFMDKTEKTYIFVDEMCRSLYVEYENDDSQHGVKGWKYTAGKSVFQSPLNNPDNACFCADMNHVTCRHDGGMMIDSCLFGTPLHVSFPHFLYEDGFYSSKLVGMHPDKEKHELVVVFEPITGVVIRAESRLQLNLFLEPNLRAPILNQIEEKFAFPLIWLNENAALRESDALWMSMLLYKLDDLVMLLVILCIPIGFALLGWAIGYPLYSKYKKKSLNKGQVKGHLRAVSYNSNQGEVFVSDEDSLNRKTGTKSRRQKTISTTELFEES